SSFPVTVPSPDALRESTSLASPRYNPGTTLRVTNRRLLSPELPSNFPSEHPSRNPWAGVPRQFRGDAIMTAETVSEADRLLELVGQTLDAEKNWWIRQEEWAAGYRRLKKALGSICACTPAGNSQSFAGRAGEFLELGAVLN